MPVDDAICELRTADHGETANSNLGAVAILWGGVAGKLTYFAIDHLLFFGNHDLRKVELFDMGLLYGVPTGLAWWLMLR